MECLDEQVLGALYDIEDLSLLGVLYDVHVQENYQGSLNLARLHFFLFYNDMFLIDSLSEMDDVASFFGESHERLVASEVANLPQVFQETMCVEGFHPEYVDSIERILFNYVRDHIVGCDCCRRFYSQWVGERACSEIDADFLNIFQ